MPYKSKAQQGYFHANKEKLEKQVSTLEWYLKRSRQWLNFSSGLFRGALNTSLQLTGQSNGQAAATLALRPRDPAQAAADPDRAIWDFPPAEALPGGDAGWGDVLDALRPPRQPGQTPSAPRSAEARTQPV